MEKLLGEEVWSFVKAQKEEIREIRIRLFRPVTVKTQHGVVYSDLIANQELINGILARATEGSFYAYEDQIAKGYIEYGKGMRIGVVGDSTFNGEKIALRRAYSLCIRIPHEIIGCAAPYVKDDFCSTLIVSPPSGGKTTMLRDFCRLLSQRYDLLVVDERYEICGADLSMKMGDRCDVVQGVDKRRVYETAIRTMAPEIVACDECVHAAAARRGMCLSDSNMCVGGERREK